MHKDLPFSRVGLKLASQTGISQLMDDLGSALAGGAPVRMLGGGNPARIPAMEAVWRRRWRELAEEGDALDRALCHYDPPQGNAAFREALAGFLRRQAGWPVTADHLCVTLGGQTAFFSLLNLLAGADPRGRRRRILFPLMPEYIGYADQGLEAGQFVAAQPRIEHTAPHRFKYHVDFDRLEAGDDIAAVCVSRPTNPTGNVLTDAEMRRLVEHTGERGIPLLVDNAYGLPFPGIVFSEATPPWAEHLVLTLSLSKLGLPGLRTGIVVARPELARALAGMNAVQSLAPSPIGPALIRPLLETDELADLSRDVIRPFYRRRCAQALEWVDTLFDPALDYHVHEPEGALFLWVWFRGLPVPAQELYARLKRRGVLVVPGGYFFYGLEADWPHARECVRVTYAQAEDDVREGLRVVAEEVRRAYGGPAA